MCTTTTTSIISLYYSCRRICSNGIWVEAAEMCFLHRPHRAVTPEPPCIYILFYTFQNSMLNHIYAIPKCSFFWGGGVSNAGCHEKPKAAWRLFVTSPWWFQKHTLLSLPGCRSPAEAFSLPERAIAMHRRAAAVMSQAIQGHPRLPSSQWLTSIFFPPPALSPRVFLLLIHHVIPKSIVWFKGLFL